MSSQLYLEAKQLPDIDVVRARFAPDPAQLPHVVVDLASLNAYEHLIGTTDGTRLAGDLA